MNEHETANADTGRDRTGTDHRFDVVVVGGGAAGLSAALVLTRARRRVAVVDEGRPRNAPAAHMHGFLGSDGRPPAELLVTGRAEVLGYGGNLLSGTVTHLSASSSSPKPRTGFTVLLDDGTVLSARRVLVTTGLRDELPHISGVRDRWGRDLLHCPYCHGYEVRDQPLGVLGGTPDSVAHALLIRQWSADVVYFAHGTTITPDEREQLVASAIGIVDEPVTGLAVENDHLTGVELESGKVVPRAAVFVRPTFVAHDTLLTDLGCAVRDNGWVNVDATGQTTVPGVWGAGNAVDPRAQVITAAGEGSAAAIAINNDLVNEDIDAAVKGDRHGLPA
jgi:thioredoxin reductase